MVFTQQGLNKYNIYDFRYFNNFILLSLSLFSLWLVVIDLSYADREWILDNEKNLGYVDVTKLSGHDLDDYNNKIKFRIIPGCVLMILKFTSAIILILDLLVKSNVKLMVFAYTITTYDLIVRLSEYIVSICYLCHELPIDELSRFFMDTTAWLLFQISFVLFIHAHIEHLITQETTYNFITHFPNVLNVDVVRQLQQRNKETRIACIANRFSTYFGKAVRHKSKIPRKRSTLLERWMHVWHGDRLREHPSQLSVSAEPSASKLKNKSSKHHSRIPLHKRHSRRYVSEATFCSLHDESSENLFTRSSCNMSNVSSNSKCCCTPLIEVDLDESIEGWRIHND